MNIIIMIMIITTIIIIDIIVIIKLLRNFLIFNSMWAGEADHISFYNQILLQTKILWLFFEGV
jgi:hypothetical protein